MAQFRFSLSGVFRSKSEDDDRSSRGDFPPGNGRAFDGSRAGAARARNDAGRGRHARPLVSLRPHAEGQRGHRGLRGIRAPHPRARERTGAAARAHARRFGAGHRGEFLGRRYVEYVRTNAARRRGEHRKACVRERASWPCRALRRRDGRAPLARSAPGRCGALFPSRILRQR